MSPFSLSELLVKAGDLIRVGPWMRLLEVIRATRLFAGVGCQLHESPAGTIISFPGGGTPFLHPFKCRLVGNGGVSVRAGTVGNKMPTMDVLGEQVPLDGGPKKDVPTLTWKQPKLKDDRGWIALRIEFTPDQLSVLRVEVVQVDSLKAAPFEALHPIAAILRKVDGSLKLHQTSHFSLQHAVHINAQSKVARHFFQPA